MGFVVARILNLKRVKLRRIIREVKKFNVVRVCFGEVNSSSSYKQAEKIRVNKNLFNKAAKMKCSIKIIDPSTVLSKCDGNHGSLYLFRKLPTDPSPKPKLTLTSHLGQMLA